MFGSLFIFGKGPGNMFKLVDCKVVDNVWYFYSNALWDRGGAMLLCVYFKFLKGKERN